MNLDQFLSEERLNNSWIREKHIDVYVRRSKRFIGNQSYSMLDVGSVEVDENFRGLGIFTAFLVRYEKEAKKLKRGVYIESILNPRLLKHLLSKGYTLVPVIDPISPSIYKLL